MQPLVMVVEDDQALLMIYQRILERLDVTLLKAQDGAIAIDLLNEYTPHIIFLDILLPRVNGFEVLSFIEQTPRLDATQVIVVSANPSFQHDAQAIRPVEFIAKPIRPDTIKSLATNAFV